MQPQPYGPTGAMTTKIGLGGAFLTATSFTDGVATVRRALELGVRYFDTSPMYCHGASQAVLGEALAGVTQEHLLATKLGYFAEPAVSLCGSACYTIRREPAAPAAQRIDTLQLHEADFHHWWSTDDTVQGRLQADVQYNFADAPALETLRTLKAQGRCRFIGISGNTADNMRRVLENVEVDTFLLAFNYDLIRRGAREVLPIAKEKGCVKLVGAIFQRGLATVQPELLEHPPQWMSAELVVRYRQIYALQRESGISLAEMGVDILLLNPMLIRLLSVPKFLRK
ncbi:MAG: aldo/keto reductase [Caldilineaceae bacterium]